MTRWAAWLLTIAGGTGVCLALYALVGQEIVSNIAETLASTPRLSTSTTLGQGCKRAKALGKRMSNRQAQRTTPIGRKQKALTDMADNEDWLDGKTKAKG